MRKAYTLGLLALLLATMTPTTVRADVLTVADGTTTNMFAPIGGYFINEYQHAQFVYPAEMLGNMTGGLISELTWYLSSTVGTPYGVGFVVSLTEVSAATSAANAFNMDPGLTQVYSGTFDGTSAELVMTLATPYTYNGGNLLVDIYTTGTNDEQTTQRFRGMNMTGAGVWTSSETTPNPTAMPQGIDWMPKTTFNYTVSDVCQRPASLTLGEVDETSFSFSWSAVADAQQYIVYFDGEEYTTTTDTSLSFSGLSAGTAYTVGVATDCGESQSIVHSATYRTACGADGVGTAWNESFGDNEALGCWTTIDADGDGLSWQVYDGSALSSYYDGDDEDADADNWLISPVITLSAADDSMMALWRVFDIPYYGNYGTLRVYAAPATGTDTSQFTLLATTGFSGMNGGMWLQQELNISAYSGQQFRLAFRHSGFDNGLRIDDVRLLSYYTPLVGISGPASVVLDESAAFSAVLLRGSENNLQYTWTSARAEAGDATIDETPDGISITYSAGEADTLILTVTNDYGTAADTMVVQLLNPYVAPTVGIDGPHVAELGDTVQFAAVIVFGSLDGMGYEWTSAMAEAGHAEMTQNDSTISISYDTTGYDTLTVIATSAYGADTATFVVLVRELNPVSEMPYTCGFEDDAENAYWQFSNYNSGSLQNKWYIGTFAQNGGQQGMYVSYAGGSSGYAGGDHNNYAAGVATLAYAARAFVAVQEGDYALQFDWKANGENTGDFLRVFVVPVATTLTTNYSQIKSSQLPSGYIAADGGSKLNLHGTEWQQGDFSFSIPEPGTYMLVFCWRNDGSIAGQPAAAVDNIQLNSLSCLHPENLVVDSTGTDYIAMHWTATGTESQWAVQVGELPEAVTTTTSYVATGLAASSPYTISVRAICGEGDTSFAIGTTANTQCGTVTEFPYTEGFENRTHNLTPYCWTPTVHYTSSSYSYPIVYGSTATAHSGEGYLYNQMTSVAGGYMITASPTLSAPANTLYGNVWVKGYSYFYDSGLQQNYEAVQIEIGVMTDPDNEETFVAILDTALNTYGGAWQQLNFSAEASGIEDYVSVAIRATLGLSSTTGYFHFDDLTVYNDGTPAEPEPEFCDAPTGLHAMNTTTNVIVLDWTPAGDEESWEISRNGVVVSAGGHPYVASGLQPETEYAFSVRAICPNGNGGLWSDTITVSTMPEEVPVCDMPTNLHSTSVTETAITLDWTPGGDETAWELERDGEIASVDSHPYTMDSLEPATNYTIRLRAVCGEGFYSDWTAAMSVSTADTTTPGPGPGPEPGDSTGISSLITTHSSLEIYPNPATSSVTVETLNGAMVSIIDLNGRVNGTWKAENGKLEIDVSQMARGAYFVRVVSSEGTAVRKLVIK